MSLAGLLQRLQDNEYVICAEGYLFEFERRGYLQAGAFVPEVVIEHPDLVEKMHEEFVHAGSDVVEAFTVSDVTMLNKAVTYRKAFTSVFFSTLLLLSLFSTN